LDQKEADSRKLMPQKNSWHYRADRLGRAHSVGQDGRVSKHYEGL
jgi:hypothetical protein